MGNHITNVMIINRKIPAYTHSSTLGFSSVRVLLEGESRIYSLPGFFGTVFMHPKLNNTSFLLKYRKGIIF